MSELPTYAPLKKLEAPVDPVARSIAKPSAFSKPGSLSDPKKGNRFRPLAVKKSPGRQRTKKRDPRNVHYF